MTTWMDKYRAEHPDMTERDIVNYRCPPDACRAGACPPHISSGMTGCVDCWYRKWQQEDEK